MHKKSNKIKWRGVAVALAAVVGLIGLPGGTRVQADSCPELRIVFARGSGGVHLEDPNYLEFRDRIDEKLTGTEIDYEFIDLDYPAVGVGIDNLGVTLGALLGGGDAYEFGKSVNAGVDQLTSMISGGCPETKYVLGGYSQGAMVVSKTLKQINPNRVIYAATLGDPKLYLPEGAGLMPAACMGAGLSNYRMYVPDCYAYKGLLGAYVPYEPGGFADKLGTWCNGQDIMCSSHLSVTDHVSYISDNLYEDVSRIIASKVTTAFGVENEYTTPHDTAILIDSTGSMSWMINQFKLEAVRLANETFEAGGRVALYDYRDLGDPYEPVARCDFATCSAENFREYLDNIVVRGGGDYEESLLSASFKVMNELSWQRGATKSLVVLTDAPFLSPDRDGTTADEVIDLSKRIDPVNVYIITVDEVIEEHPEVSGLAEATGGFATSELGELNLLTDYIMDRYDTLPRVEEMVDESLVPTLEIVETNDNGTAVTVNFAGDMTRTIVTLNEAVLGMVEGNEVTLDGLDRNIENLIRLIPTNDSRKGDAAEIVLPIIKTEMIEVPVDKVVEKVTEVERTIEVPVEKTVEIERIVEKVVEIEQTVEGPIEVEKVAEQPVIIEKVIEVPVAKDGFGGELIASKIEPRKDPIEGNDEVKSSVSNIAEIMVPKTPDTGMIK